MKCRRERRHTFLENMIDRVFKLLPMRELEDLGEETFLGEYLQELAIEANGAYFSFPELSKKAKYVSVTNTLQYMRQHWSEMEFAAFRRSVLKMTNILAGMAEEAVR